MIHALWRSREGRGLLAIDAAAAVVCAFLPLADHLGFEFAEALTLVNAIAAPFVGFAAARIASAVESEQRRPARAAAYGGLFAVGSLVVPTLLILLNGVRRPLCEPITGAVWMLLLPAPTAWLGATLGSLARFRLARLAHAIAAVALVELATVAITIATAYWGPVYFAFDHFAGYFPGPMLDETIPVTAALVSFRLATVLWGAVAVTAAGAFTRGDGAIRRMHAGWCVTLTIVLIAASAGWGADFGWRTTDRSLTKAINGEIRVEGLVIHYPRGWSDRQVETLVRDATFDAAQLQRAFGIIPSHLIHIWMYPGAEAKERPVGARWTSFAKPYRHEIHVQPGGYPHVPLRHELVHAMAGEFATGPFLTPGIFLPSGALVEGFAVAYDIDDGTLTLAQRAKAMRDLHLAPNLVHILSPWGFEVEAPGRAYSYAGAFIRYLSTRFDTPAMRMLYRTGDLGSLGTPAATLVRDFEEMLDTVHVDDEGRSIAARRFAEPSMFTQRCPHEVRTLVDSAYALADDRRWSEALAMFDKVCAFQPDDPDLVRDKLNVVIRMKGNDVGLIQAVAATLWSHPRLDPELEASSLLQVGNELWRRGDSASGHALYLRSASLPVGPETHRATIVRLRALADPSLGELLKPMLVDNEGGPTQTFRMLDALAKHPNDALVLYLLGRQVRGAADKAAEYMERADRIGLGDAELIRENLRMLVVARAQRNRCDEAERARMRLRTAAGTATDDATAANWVARCRFAVARGWKPLPPP